MGGVLSNKRSVFGSSSEPVCIGSEPDRGNTSEKSRHGYPQRVTSTGYLGRLGLVDRLDNSFSHIHTHIESHHWFGSNAVQFGISD